MFWYGTSRMDRHHMRSARFAVHRGAHNTMETRTRFSRELGGVEDHVDRLALICEAMWTLIEDNTDLTTDDLFAQIAELDDRDGKADLSRQRVAQPCECGAKVPVRAAKCQFCGADAPYSTPFDLI